ncbi:EamA family transporter [uncultured Castellaniella sp.]|uniref:EamA family transporter n=1 Tax=uncultured Castellaniella sp. TaxID=647907 RepID=UPI0026135D35|nr:EamA family transporter [uncultured Castellaniella sp.]
MPLKDILAALVVIVVWGANFVVIKFGVDEIPPMLLGALRFLFVAFPAIFFVPRPAVPWRYVAGYGATICLGQFVFLFLAIYLGMPAGLASLVLQAQAFFTVAIAALALRESIRAHHVLGMGLAVAGLVMLDAGADSTAVPLTGFLLTLLAAFSWACGNIVLKRAGQVRMLSMVVWGALLPPIPFLLLSAAFEGPDRMLDSLTHLSWRAVGVVVYLSGVATLVGYVLWGRLLSRHPVARVAPLSLLIPVVGLLCADWTLGERLGPWQWLGGGVVLIGLTVNLFGARWAAWLRNRAQPT